MKCYKRLIAVVLFMIIITVIFMMNSNQAAASQAWTHAWKTIGSAADGGPANPFSIAADDQGNVFVTNGSDISKLPSGSSLWQTLSKTGLSGSPDSIAVDQEGNLYVSDSNNNLVQKMYNGSTEWVAIGGEYDIQVWIPGERVFIYIVGSVYTSGFWAESTANNGQIYGPLGVAVDSSLNVYVTNQGYYDSATYYNSCEKFSNGTWNVIGNQLNNSLHYIQDITTDASGDVYVTTQYSSGTRQGRDAIFKYSGGNWTQIGQTGVNEPVMPGGIAVDKWGNVYVASWGDHTVKVLANGQWTTIGGYGVSGPGQPRDVAVDGLGNVYVTDSTNKTIMKLQAPATQLVWLTQPSGGIAGKAPAQPPVVALVDAHGNIETEDSIHTVTLNLNNGNGAVLKQATVKLVNGVATFSDFTVSNVGSGLSLTPSCNLSAGLTAQQSNSFDMAAPPSPTVTGISPASGVGGTRVTVTGSNLTAASYVEFGTAAGLNPVVNSDTSITVTAPTQGAGLVDVRVTTPGGKSPVNAPADQFTYNQPGNWVGSWVTVGNSGTSGKSTGIATDISGNVYVVDDAANQIKKLYGGTWSVIYSGFSNLHDVFVDVSGNVYCTDTGASNYKVYKNGSVIGNFSDYNNPVFYGTIPYAVTADKLGNVYVGCAGKVLKWDGITWADISYDGSFNLVRGIVVDDLGNLYAGDSSADKIKKLSAGSAQWVEIGNGIDCYGLALDKFGNLYAADYSSNTVRELRIGMSIWIPITINIYNTSGVAVDGSGNLYATGSTATGSGLVMKHQAPATRLVWQVHPGNGYEGKDLVPYPALALMDAYGNIMQNDNSDMVTLNLYSTNGAVLEGATTVQMVNGVAHFVNLSIDRKGSGYALIPSASLPGIALSDSNPFNITDAPAPPQPVFWTGSWTTLSSGVFTNAVGVAVDDGLSVYAVDQTNWLVKNWTGDGNWYPIQTVGLGAPSGVAVRTNGASTDVYVADSNNYRVTLNGNTLGGDFYNPSWDYFVPRSIAAGQNGNVYAAGKGGGTGFYVLRWDGSVWSNISFHGAFSNPQGIAVDSSGNLYVADTGKKEIYCMPAGTTQWKTIGTGFSSPTGIAVDSLGNVYVADNGTGTVKALQAGTDQWVIIPGAGTYGVTGVGTDKFGNLYAAFNSYIYKHQAPATGLVWQTQPGGGTGGTAWPQQPVLCLQDANGNIVINDSSSVVTIALTDESDAVLEGTTQVTLQNGIAAFTGLKVNRAGSYKLTASCAEMNSGESNVFDVTIGPAARLGWHTQPGGGTSGQSWTRQPILSLQDAGGNITLDDSTSVVTIALNNASGAVLNGILQTTVQNGMAAFSNLSINKAGDYTVTASCGSLTSSASSTFNISPGAASRLVWQTQPAGCSGGAVWTQQPVLYLADANGNIITNDSTSKVTVSLTNANGAILGGTTQVTFNNGIASFTDLKIDKTGTYTLTPVCSLSSITGNVSEPFTVTVGPASRLTWHVQPGGGSSMQNWLQQPVLYLEDAGGNILEGDSSKQITAELNDPNGAVLGGTALITIQNGAAVFTDLNIDKAGTYTLTPVINLPGINCTISDPFTVTPGAAAQLKWQTQPGGGTGGSVWLQQPALCLEDAYGNIVTDDSSSTLTVALTASDGAVLGGCTQVTLHNGVTAFTDLRVDKVGSYRLTAACGGITSQDSNLFDIALSEAAGLVWHTQPTGAISGSILAIQPVLYLEDAGGNVKTDDSSSVVTVILSDASGAVLDGTSQTSLLNGVAAFGDLKVLKAGSYSLTASCGSISSTTSSSFTITPGAAAQLVWKTQPGGGIGGTAWLQQPEIVLEDDYGNILTEESSAIVTISLNSANSASLLGTTQATLRNGRATFNNLAIDRIGTNYTLAVSISLQGIASPVSSPFNITLGSAARLTWHTQPQGSASGAPLGTQPVLCLEDSGGNIVTGDNSSIVTIALTGSNGAILNGKKTVTVQDGAAYFIDLEVARAGSYTLAASCGSISSTTSSPFIITPGAAAQLVWKIQPGDGLSGSDMNPQPELLLEDAYGNIVTDDSSSIVTISLNNPGTAILSGTASIPLNSGVAVFNGLKVDKAGSYSMTVSCGNITSTASTAFTIVSGTVNAGQSTIAAAKSSVTADGIDSSTITVMLKDPYGNPVSGETVTLDQGSGSSVITPVQGISDANGAAVFTVNSIVAECVTYTALVDNVSVTGTLNVIFIPGPAAKLVWSTQPGSGARDQVLPRQPVLVLEDAFGNTQTGDSSSMVGVMLANPNGALLEGTTQLILSNGVAAFSNLKVNQTGNYTLTPSIDLPGIALTDSNTFGISLLNPPEISPAEGTYIGSVTVGITYDLSYEAYYSLDGSSPTLNSERYNCPFAIGQNRTVKAAVYDAVNGQWSSEASRDFIIQAAIPDADISSGSILPNNSVVNLLDSTTGVAIYYTVDGSTPTAASASGTSVTISGVQGATVVLKAYAAKVGCKDSDIAVFQYIIESTASNGDNDGNTDPEEQSAGNLTQIVSIDSNGKVTVPAVMNPATGTASSIIHTDVLFNAFNRTASGENGVKTVEIGIPKMEDASEYEFTLPASFLSSGDHLKMIEIQTDIASVSLPGNMIPADNAAGAQNVSLTIGTGERTNLSAEVQAQIGNKPLIELTLKVDGKKTYWNNDSAPVTVTIPYTPTPEELKNPEHITVWYIDGSGNPIPVPNGKYDAATGKVTFRTAHFSKFAIVFVQKTFADIDDFTWAGKQIEVMASKGIINGTSETTFNPSAKITRADFLVMLVRTLGITAKIDSNFNDVKPGDYYYEALGIAKMLDISRGTGNNLFDPHAEIKRQDMMTLAARAMKVAGKLQANGTSSDLSTFTDNASVAPYAVEAVGAMIKEGLIMGSGSFINPASDATRAETAVFMYRIYQYSEENN